jgi:hypothetical protein
VPKPNGRGKKKHDRSVGSWLAMAGPRRAEAGLSCPRSIEARLYRNQNLSLFYSNSTDHCRLSCRLLSFRFIHRLVVAENLSLALTGIRARPPASTAQTHSFLSRSDIHPCHLYLNFLTKSFISAN